MVLVLLEPEKFFQQVLEESKTRLGLYFLIFFSAFLGFMTGALLNNFALAVGLLVLFVILALVKVLIWAVVSHLIARFVFKGEGGFTTLYCLFGFSSAAFIVGILGLALFMASGKLILAALILWLLMIVWMVVLLTVAVDKAYKIGYGRAFLSVIGIPFLVIAFIGPLMGVL
jgi:hypothetical protein